MLFVCGGVHRLCTVCSHCNTVRTTTPDYRHAGRLDCWEWERERVGLVSYQMFVCVWDKERESMKLWIYKGCLVNHFWVNEDQSIIVFKLCHKSSGYLQIILILKVCVFICCRSSEAGWPRVVSSVLHHLEGDWGRGTGGLYVCFACNIQLKGSNLEYTALAHELQL